MKNVINIIKRNIILFFLALVFLTSIFYIQKISAKSVYKDRVDAIKEEIKQKKSKDDSSIVIQGKNFVLSENEIKLKTEVYKIKGDNKPEEAAIRHLIERKVLLNKSLEMGYFVTEDEIDAQISLVKEAVKTTENYEEYKDIVAEYGGEDVYWSDIRETTRESMIINKYLDYEKEIYNKNKKDNEVIQFNSNLLDGWNKEKAKIINNLVKDQEIKILDSKYKEVSLTW